MRRMLRRGGARPDEDGRYVLLSPDDVPDLPNRSASTPRRGRAASGRHGRRPGDPASAPRHPRSPLRGLGHARLPLALHLTDRPTPSSPTNAVPCPIAPAPFRSRRRRVVRREPRDPEGDGQRHGHAGGGDREDRQDREGGRALERLGARTKQSRIEGGRERLSRKATSSTTPLRA